MHFSCKFSIQCERYIYFFPPTIVKHCSLNFFLAYSHFSQLTEKMAGYGQRAQLLQCVVSCLLLLPPLVDGAIAGGDGGGGSVDLSYGYYNDSCPELEVIVRNALLPIFMTDPRSPAAFLRLLFHDCQVQGCDASILLDYDFNQGTTEMASSKNFGIRNRESISEIKSVVEQVCPGQVSCADILALAARDSVAYSGGPYMAIPLGRKDSTTSSIRRADEELPSAALGSDGALRLFADKGMTIEESVAIMGGHTLGTGHCINIVHRLYDSKDRVQHEEMEWGFEALLRLKCPTQVPLTNDTFVVNDLTTLVFDNQYYRNVVGGRGLFTVDAAIASDPRTAPIVRRFAADQAYFFRAFSSAFVKLSSAVVPATDGQIRRRCNRVN